MRITTPPIKTSFFDDLKTMTLSKSWQMWFGGIYEQLQNKPITSATQPTIDVNTWVVWIDNAVPASLKYYILTNIDGVGYKKVELT